MNVGFVDDICVVIFFICMYMICGSIEGVCRVFDNMKVCDVVLWIVMIEGYVENGNIEDVFGFFVIM